MRDLATAYHTLLDRGATIVRPPRREPWGLNEMWIPDPDGLRIGIIEVPPQHPLRRDPRDSPTRLRLRRGEAGNQLQKHPSCYRWGRPWCRSPSSRCPRRTGPP